MWYDFSLHFNTGALSSICLIRSQKKSQGYKSLVFLRAEHGNSHCAGLCINLSFSLITLSTGLVPWLNQMHYNLPLTLNTIFELINSGNFCKEKWMGHHWNIDDWIAGSESHWITETLEYYLCLVKSRLGFFFLLLFKNPGVSLSHKMSRKRQTGVLQRMLFFKKI